LDVAFTSASQIIVNNKGNITSSSNSYGVNVQTLAIIIYTEQHYNVNWVDFLTDFLGALLSVDTSI